MFTEKKDIVRFGQASSKLYNQLIKPIEPFISGKKLSIIPDRELSYLPFDVLLTSWQENQVPDLKSLKYLIREYAINYSYSSELMFSRLKTNKARNELIAFAPDYSSLPGGDQSEWSSFAPIQGIREEVSFIRRWIRTKAFEDAAATEENFRKNAQDFDIIHLAMHTRINDSLPMFSKLAFTPNPQGPIENDGWLNTSDIYNLKLAARMVVLSACNTGSGKLRDGDGIISLARGFSFAGCPSVVMTLWEVRDRSGTAIMENFYRKLKNGKPKDEALRLAKLDYLSHADPLTAHPHFWLGYVTIGDPDPLFRNKGFSLLLLLLPAMILLVFQQVARHKKARQGPGNTDE